MGLFSGLFGRKASQQEQLEQARKLLEETRQLAASSSPDKALKQLRKGSASLYAVVGLSGELNAAFAELIEQLWARQAPRGHSLPSVKVLSWSTWPEPKIADLHAAAEHMAEDVLYCQAPQESPTQDAFSELEALDTFGQTPDVAMIVIGGENMFFRRDFLLTAAASVDLESEDVGQDLADHAKAMGKQSLFY